MAEQDDKPIADAVRQQLEAWDAAWTADYALVTDAPAKSVLPPKFVALVGVAISSACTSLNAQETRRYIRAALAAGASRDEILFVIKCGSVMSIHSVSLGAPILIEEAKEAGAPMPQPSAAPTPACDAMRAVGQWNAAWDPFFALDPSWTDSFMAVGAGIYKSGVLSPKEVELLSIAFDASFTHMYAPGTRRHIRNALKAGASVAEVLCVLELCVAHGAQACNMAVPILAEELARQH